MLPCGRPAGFFEPAIVYGSWHHRSLREKEKDADSFMPPALKHQLCQSADCRLSNCSMDTREGSKHQQTQNWPQEPNWSVWRVNGSNANGAFDCDRASAGCYRFLKEYGWKATRALKCQTDPSLSSSQGETHTITSTSTLVIKQCQRLWLCQAEQVGMLVFNQLESRWRKRAKNFIWDKFCW